MWVPVPDPFIASTSKRQLVVAPEFNVPEPATRVRMRERMLHECTSTSVSLSLTRSRHG